ncbi:MAG: dockerin type I domain-containing protein [Phycisphaerae bacterium]|jgi:hypothetical protein
MFCPRSVAGLFGLVVCSAFGDAGWDGAQGSSFPPDGAVDARVPWSAGDRSVLLGWDSVTVAIDKSAGRVTPGAFAVEVSEGAVPTIVNVTARDGDVTLLFDRPIPAGASTTVTHCATGTSVRLGFLPGDVDGNGRTGAADLLRLVDAINGTGEPLPMWSADVDRSGVIDRADVDTLVTMLSGRGAFDGWIERRLPGTWHDSAGGGSRFAEVVGSALIELVPSGTFIPLGGSVTVEVFMTQTGGPDPVLARLVELDFAASDAELTLSAPGSSGTIVELFDFVSAGDCPGTCGDTHAIDSVFPVVLAAFFGAGPDADLQMNLFDGAPTKIAEIVVSGSTPGMYTLDALNGGAPGPDDGAQLSFGFGEDIDGIPITDWTAFDGEVTGEALVFEVGPCTSDAECDDRDPCTTDRCAGGVCENETVGDGTPCANGQFCDGDELCVAGVCEAGSPRDCDDDIDCTNDSCDEVTDACQHDPLDSLCEDGNPCTDDVCEVDLGCAFVPNDANDCADLVFCNGVEHCVSGVCEPGTPPSCDDGVACTLDSCDVVTDACRFDPQDTVCDDGAYCNGVEACDVDLGCVAGDEPCGPGLICDEDADRCVEGAIPAVSTWGLAALLLCFLVGAKTVFLRYRVTQH